MHVERGDVVYCTASGAEKLAFIDGKVVVK